MFFRDAFLDLIFLHFMLIFARKWDFWTPFEIRWGPKWRPKSPKWRQNVVISRKPRRPLCGPEADVLPGPLSECSWPPFWSIWDGFCMDFSFILDWFWHHSRTCREPARNLQEMQRTFGELARTRQTNLKITNGIWRFRFSPWLRLSWSEIPCP